MSIIWHHSTMGSTSKKRSYSEMDNEEAVGQIDPASPQARISKLLYSDKMADLTITFPGQGKDIKAHRLVLGMSSPVFEAMLFGPLAERETLHLPDDPPEIFKMILSYMYCGTCHIESLPAALEVLKLSHKYQMDHLVSQCSRYLRDHLTPRKVPLVYDTAIILEDKRVINKCLMMMQNSTREVINSKIFGAFSSIAMRHFLRLPMVDVPEVEMFNAVVKWGRLRLPRSNHEEVRKLIEKLLPLVRVLILTPEEMVDHVIPSQMYTDAEIVGIMKNLKTKTPESLPKICSPHMHRRKRHVKGILKGCYASFDNFSKLHVISLRNDTIMPGSAPSQHKIDKKDRNWVNSSCKCLNEVHNIRHSGMGNYYVKSDFYYL